jgi:hypothetical protein
MELIKTLSYILISISIISLLTKIYYHNRFLNKPGRPSRDIFARQYYSIKYLVPIRADADDAEKSRFSKKGNKALTLFYIAFTSMLMISLIGYLIGTGRV